MAIYQFYILKISYDYDLCQGFYYRQIQNTVVQYRATKHVVFIQSIYHNNIWRSQSWISLCQLKRQ
jgi:hypothetical protein